jgi:glycosyltransferase involved in cell wall biosynthesis
MRIGIDARMYGAESTSGIGVYIQQLIKHLQALTGEHDVFVFTRDVALVSRDIHNPHWHVVAADFQWYSVAEQTRFLKLLYWYRLDLLHVPHFNVPLLYRRPFVVTIHDVTPQQFPGPLVKRSLLRRLAYQLVFRHAVRSCKKLITISRHTRQQIEQYVQVRAHNTVTIYPGIDSKFTNPTLRDNAKVLECKNFYSISSPYILYVGVWRDHKNIIGLVKAFELMCQQGNTTHVLVLGGKPDPGYPEISEYIDASPVRSRILTLGFVSDTHLPALYAGADVFVLPSFNEGFGLVVVEALLCGTPVAASSTTSVPEILQNAGIYFDPYNHVDIARAINQITANPQQKKELIISGLKICQQYTWDICAKKHFEVYLAT